jgi:CRP/FNR family cyclic AMP-dependent transcriptional regulator
MWVWPTRALAHEQVWGRMLGIGPSLYKRFFRENVPELTFPKNNPMSTSLPPTAVNVEAFLRQSLFGALPAAEFARLVRQARVETFEHSCQVNAAGQTLQWLRLVIEGSLNIAATHRNGKEVLISTIGPGAWVAWLPCFVPEPLATDYTAMPGSVFIALPISAVRASFNAHPALYPLVLKEIDKRMRLLMEWTSQSALLMPEQRLARLLTLLARDRKLGATDCSLAVTQAQLATLIGCSRQSANRLVANLARKGLIRLGYGTCEIPDLAALRAFSEQGP